jgi:hypothetical protein
MNRYIVIDDERLLWSTGSPSEAIQLSRCRPGRNVAVLVTHVTIGMVDRLIDVYDARSISAALRRAWRMQRHSIDNRCDYCRQPTKFEFATVDHKVPLCDGGADTVENWVLACDRCNHQKGRMSVAEYFQWIASAPGFRGLVGVDAVSA